MTHSDLTPARKAALEAYRRFVQKHGKAPTVRELGAALGKSHARAHSLARELEALGYIEKKVITIVRPIGAPKKRKTA